MGNAVSSKQFVHTIVDSSSLVSQLVRSNCVVIFSTTTCPYCKTAKEVFDDMGVPYQTVEIDERQDGSEIVKQLRSITGMKTVPQVFVNGNCIGGGTETKNLHLQGKLARLVKECKPCNDHRVKSS